MKRFTPAWFRSVIHWKMMALSEGIIDLWLTGHHLAQRVKNIDGSTGTQPSHYLILKHIHKEMVTLTVEDHVIDVGCGQGRVLAYLHHKYPSVKLTGVDFNKSSIAIARQWADKKSIDLYCEDALSLDYNPYTVLYLFRPFPPSVFLQFIERLEKSLTHPIRMIYMSDQESGHFLRCREGWTLLHREKIFKLQGLQVASSPQGCSVWELTPL